MPQANHTQADEPKLTVVEKADFLQEVDIFAHTKTEDLARIALITEELEFVEGDVIFREKERGNALFFVILGEVRLLKEDRERQRVGARESFGDLALLDNQPREFTAVAAQPTTVLSIKSEEFFELVEDHVEITRAVFQSLTGRIRELVQK